MDGCGGGGVKAGGARHALPEKGQPKADICGWSVVAWIWRAVSVRILSSPVLLVMSGFVIVLIPWILFVTLVVIGGFVWALPPGYSYSKTIAIGECFWTVKLSGS